jgi:restriction system protein
LDIVFHYPPELLSLLIETIPRLCRSKRDVVLFLQGAGVSAALTSGWAAQIQSEPDKVSKFAIARDVLTELNKRGESTLRERREILKRVTEFEEFSVCWPEDQLKAKGLVAEISRVVNVKDSFTRMNQEREGERRQRTSERAAKLEEQRIHREQLRGVQRDLLQLFAEDDPVKRGKASEGVLSRLFESGGVLVREAFTVTGADGEGVVEQIDGVIELDGQTYLVEMRWRKDPSGRAEVSEHLVRIYHRGQARGVFISAAGYTEPAIATCKEALQRTVVVLCKLEEVVLLLERETDLRAWLKAKINAAQLDKNPMYEPLS